MGSKPDDVLALHMADVRKQMSHKVYLPEEYPLFEIRVTRMHRDSCRIHFSIDE